jgi:hypothetical protein
MMQCEIREDRSQPSDSVVFHTCNFLYTVHSSSAVEDEIADFLDGKTHGETVLHALYDPILDEPIPGRMRALFDK